MRGAPHATVVLADTEGPSARLGGTHYGWERKAAVSDACMGRVGDRMWSGTGRRHEALMLPGSFACRIFFGVFCVRASCAVGWRAYHGTRWRRSVYQC
jgi:hypothetical protein